MFFVQSIIADCLYQKINENPWQSFCGANVLRVCEGPGFILTRIDGSFINTASCCMGHEECPIQDR